MFKKYIERVKDAGVVGAGGAGFPTHVKLGQSAEVVIVNGAECEPLLRVDQQLMLTFAEDLIKGLKVAMKITEAPKGVICIKGKHKDAVEKLEMVTKDIENISVLIIDDYYPAGDEQQLVYEVTGKVIPPGGLPIHVGAVVNNVATLLNIAAAVESEPVTSRYVTITGEVKNPMTLNVPIGTSVRTLIQLAEGPKEETGYSLILGGPAMGKVTNDWDVSVTKTLNGIIVLSSDHALIVKKSLSIEREATLAKAACCQCNNCSVLCPRNALGIGTEPHKVMRSIGYESSEFVLDLNTLMTCCDCGLCTYYGCDMGLAPSKVMQYMKGKMLEKGLRPNGDIDIKVSPSKEYRKVPTKRLLKRMHLSKYDVAAPINTDLIHVNKVKIPLKQHIGASATSLVALGDHVEKNQLIAGIDDGKLGANIHASISGKIVGMDQDYIEILA